MGNRRNLGDKLFLKLQLGDGDANIAQVRVFIELKDQAGVLTEPRFEIFHVSDGLYKNDVKTMPSEDEVTAHYFITRNDGVTLTNKYDPKIYMESFVLGIVTPEDISGAVGGISLVGIVDEFSTIGGEFDKNLISGIVAEENLIGIITEDTNLQGEIDECV